MVFSSTVFLLVFLPALLILYYLPIKKEYRNKWHNFVLLVFSVGFYAWGEPVFVFIMLGSVAVNWLLALIMARSENHKKAWLTTAVVFDVLMIGVFKYASFISKNLAAITGNDKLIISIALPIGISFFTFQIMSYVFDVYYGTTQVQKNPLYVALYISLFPQLIAGPIVRYQDIADEILNRNETFALFTSGVKRFIYGLGKKVLLANFLARIADNTFDYISVPSVMMAWLGVIAYALQIYFDFSGYSDMAIGLGRMFGFHFLENFNFPYIAKSITDFWRRWHISLSTWFRDYVYIPLGGSRVKKSRWVINLFITWLLTGIWHGANWTFLLWGLIYFVFLLIERTTGFTNKIGWASHIYTLAVVLLAWVFFRAPDIASGMRYIGHMFGVGVERFWDNAFSIYVKGSYLILIAALIGATPLVSKAFQVLREKRLAWIESAWLIVVFVLSLLEVVSSTYNPFIYFNF